MTRLERPFNSFQAKTQCLANRIELFGKQLVPAGDLLDDVVAKQMLVGGSLTAEVKYLVFCDADGPGAKRPGRVVLLELSHQRYGHPLKHFIGLLIMGNQSSDEGRDCRLGGRPQGSKLFGLLRLHGFDPTVALFSAQCDLPKRNYAIFP